MDRAPLNLYSIAPDQPFADTLAQGLLAETGGDPMALARYLILLPNRRAARSLREAFLRHSKGAPMLLPRARAVDRIDEDELAFLDEGPLDLAPAISTLERRLLLARMIMASGTQSPDQALLLAEELAKLLDSLQIENIDPQTLATLELETDLARHWQKTLDFLGIVTSHWPLILAARGQLDPQDRINRLLDAQTERWRAQAPSFPIIAAGSTGTRPATARMLSVVARLPNGRVVLPGLDWDLDEAAWDVLDESHPQYGMKKLIASLGGARDQVKPFAPRRSTPRARLLSEIMRPAKATEAWRHLGTSIDATALDGVHRLDLASPAQEAGVIALILRQALDLTALAPDRPPRTAALVTPDRALAARVRAELSRWDIEIDDSAGVPITATPPGTFLALLAEAFAVELAPHPLLALLKHPFSHGGMDRGRLRLLTDRLEIKVLRGPRPAPGLDGLRAALLADHPLQDFIAALDAALGPLESLFAQASVSLTRLVTTHLECAERLAADPLTPGPLRLWAGEAGEALAAHASDLIASADALGEINPAHYPALFQTLLNGLVVRPRWGRHPRLFLWGPIEARLQRADVMILAGLNEGTWPPDAAPDPWMSRPMRAKIGLPLPERRIGLAAHDFVQGLGAEAVYLTRSTRVEGTPTTPARWLLRLQAVMTAAHLTWAESADDWVEWLKAMDRAQYPDPPRIPAPTPPVAARPRDLPVTAIETWMRDPYAVYAKYILRLRALDPIDADPGAADYGQLVHKALETFLAAHPGPLPTDALDRLLSVGREVFADAMERPGVRAFWGPRFESVAAWVIDWERARRARVRASHFEVEGALDITATGMPFRLRARADRIDELTDGSLAIIDYKTGKPPSEKEVAAGYAPQLPLEAAIAQGGGFAAVPALPVTELLFWQLKGGQDGGLERKAAADAGTVAQEALDGLIGLIRAFDDPRTPYEARPHPDHAPKYSDYLHLARVAEWSSGEGGAQDGGADEGDA